MPPKFHSLPQPASTQTLSKAFNVLAPWQRLCSPVFLGLDNIPQDSPALFIGNHTIGGLLDAPLMIEGLLRHRGIHMRALGDSAHFKVPLWGSLLQAGGSVEGSRDNCRALMQAKENILVYPGGGREVLKRKGEKYSLIWKQRYGFARMALENNYTIIPFAAVGAEECYNILYDADQLLSTRTGKLITKMGVADKFIPPLMHGIGPTLIPKPQRMYFKFGQPIDSTKFKTVQADDDPQQLRAATAKQINKMLVELLDYRHIDPDQSLKIRLLKSMGIV